MNRFSRIGMVVFAVIVTGLSVILPGCQTQHAYSHYREGSAFEPARDDGRSCRLG